LVVIILNVLEFILLNVSKNNQLDFNNFCFSDFKLISKKNFLPFFIATISGVILYPVLFLIYDLGCSKFSRSALISVKPLAFR
jgi:uncharacterized PurR-regulated membrane protein YhhQ (DUF165 family)